VARKEPAVAINAFNSVQAFAVFRDVEAFHDFGAGGL